MGDLQPEEQLADGQATRGTTPVAAWVTFAAVTAWLDGDETGANPSDSPNFNTLLKADQAADGGGVIRRNHPTIPALVKSPATGAVFLHSHPARNFSKSSMDGLFAVRT